MFLFPLFEGDKVRDMVRFITPLPLVDRLRKHRVKRWKRGEAMGEGIRERHKDVVAFIERNH